MAGDDCRHELRNLPAADGALEMSKILIWTTLTLAILCAPLMASAQDVSRAKMPAHAKQEQVAHRVSATTAPATSCSLSWFAVFFGAPTANPRCGCLFSSCSGPVVLSRPLMLGVGF
jgi:hypothetical protein